MATGAEPSAARLGSSQIAAVLLVGALTGVGGGVALHFLLPGPTRPTSVARNAGTLHGEATWAAGARPAPPIAGLRDQVGHPFALSSLRGRTVVMAFLDSHCTAACPLEGRALAAAERSLPGSRRPVLVAVSVNPLDTPASARAAARTWGLAGIAPWHWLTGPSARLRRVWRAYHIYVGPKVRGDISHTEAIYLLDRRGDERSAYLYPFAPRLVTSDLRVLSARGNRHA